MPALHHRHVGLPSLSAFLPAAKYRKEDGKKKKTLSVSEEMRQDKATSAVLNGPWIVTGPLFPPVIEGVSVTLLIVYSNARSWASRAASNLLIAVLAELSRFVLH